MGASLRGANYQAVRKRGGWLSDEPLGYCDLTPEEAAVTGA
jgi:hypothetical protein